MTYLVRCHAIGTIMPDGKGSLLSVGAKTYLRQEVRRMFYGYRETFSSKPTEKGLRCEDESIQLFNDVFLTDHVKNTERKSDGLFSGECDIPGIDIKTSWSLATFPAFVQDAHNSDYEWQARGYMRLWDMPHWDIAYCMVDTPDDLIGFEPREIHKVSHIDDHKRITVVRYMRDAEKEARMVEKAKAAQQYVAEMLQLLQTEKGI